MSSCFSVSVPTSLYMHQLSSGRIVMPSDFRIENSSLSPIAVSSIDFRCTEGFTLEDYSSRFELFDVGEKRVAFEIDGFPVPKTGSADLTGVPFLSAGESHSLGICAKAPLHGTSEDNIAVADVVVTVSWREDALYSIAVTRMPDKTCYLDGENFSSEGMEITALYFGGRREIISTYSVTDGTDLKPGTSSVTVLASKDGREKYCSVPVTVKKILSAIEIASPPAITDYLHSDRFNDAGMVVNAVYSDGSKSRVTAYSVKPEVLRYTDSCVTVVYEESGIAKSTPVNVNVKRVLSSIVISRPPDTTSYCHGEKFSPSGAVVKALYKDGGSEDITVRVSWSPAELKYGMSEVKASYEYEGKIYTAVQNIRTSRRLSSLELKTMPEKLTYYDGEDADLKGMVLMLNYTDGSFEETSDYTFSPKKLALGDSKITVTSHGRDVEIPVSVGLYPSILNCEISLEGNTYTYDKTPKTPKAVVKFASETLSEGKDYILSYRDNINAGTAAVTVSGTGRFKDSRDVPFTISRRGVTASFQNLSIECRNENVSPSVTLSNVISGDDCRAVLEDHASYAPGTYALKIASLTNDNYCLLNNDICVYEVYAGTAPTLASGSIASRLKNAGLSPKNGYLPISGVEFKSCYIPNGSETLSLVLDENGEGKIKGYLVPSCTYSGQSYSKLIISGNGSGTIYANPDSSYAFCSLCHYITSDIEVGFANLRMLNTSKVTSMSYMFSDIYANSLDLSSFATDCVKRMDHMFYLSSVKRLNLGSMSTFSVENMSFMFAYFSLDCPLNLKGFDTSNTLYMGSMFMSFKSSGTVDVSSFNTCRVRDMSDMFSSASFSGGIDVASFDTSSCLNTSGMFSSLKISQSVLDLRSWNVSNVKTMSGMFENTCFESVYLCFDTSSCTDFSFMFAGRNSRLKNIFDKGTWNVQNAISYYQYPFSDNPNFENSGALDVFSLKGSSSGGVFIADF